MSKLYSCDYCEKKFKANFTLRRHVRQLHPGDALPNIRTGRKPKIDLKVSCSHCDQSLSNERALAYHIKRHHLVRVAQRKSARAAGSDRRTLEFNDERGKCMLYVFKITFM